MKHSAESHPINRPLVWIWATKIHSLLPMWLRKPERGATWTPSSREILWAVGWFVALVIQAVLIYVASELIEIAQGVMQLYLELARTHLDLTSLYVKATAVRPA